MISRILVQCCSSQPSLSLMIGLRYLASLEPGWSLAGCHKVRNILDHSHSHRPARTFLHHHL